MHIHLPALSGIVLTYLLVFARVGAMMMFKGHWKGKGVFNVEQLPSKPFMDEIGKQGLPWHQADIKVADQKDLFAVKT